MGKVPSPTDLCSHKDRFVQCTNNDEKLNGAKCHPTERTRIVASGRKRTDERINYFSENPTPQKRFPAPESLKLRYSLQIKG